jgi:hypothetical protein
MIKHIVLIAILVIGFVLWNQRPVKHGPGVIAPDAPTVQRAAVRGNFDHQHYELIPKWKIEGTLRVLSKNRYWFDEKKNIAPVDFVFGWADMSDERILSQVKAPISNRNFELDVIAPPLTFEEIRNLLLFIHAVPSNEEVWEAIKNVREGQLVRFKGYFVDVHDQSDLIWKSSYNQSQKKLDNPQITWIESFSIQEY